MVVLNKGKGKKGKSKGKNMRGGAIGGNYEFTNDEIYFFSDLEGNMPDGIKELMFETTLTDGEKIFEMDEKGIIEIPKSLENKVIVFTGDLIDRGEYSIRNLRRMLALKEKAGNEGRVILLCGNRDTNKIRMYHECHIKAIEDNILRNKKEIITVTNIISKLKDIQEDTQFTNNGEDIATIINITGILKNLNTARTYDDNFKKSYTDDISRIENMYSNTLGSPNQVENFKKEFKVLFGIGNVFEEDKITLLKFIAMMNMVMGKIWGAGVLPTILEPYNGLYIKYLQQCHIMASITIGDKLCFASHAGIPYKDKEKTIESEGSFYIPIEIGKVPSPMQDHRINNGVATYTSTTKYTISHYYYINNIDNLNRSFDDFITKKFTNGNTVIDDEYKKYVAMSANCDIQSIDGTELSAYASPIVSRKNIEEVKDKKNLSLDKFIKKGSKTTKVYNIFGHQPSGLLPYISKTDVVDGITSYHIDLDISRAEGIDSNKESYVYLKMTNDKDMLFGKIESKNKHDIINGEVNTMDTEDTAISFNYEVALDTYCLNSIVDVEYTKPTNDGEITFPLSTLFTVDNTKYYGMFGITLVETGNKNKFLKGGRGKTRIYTKSIKRFLYGKRKMVIYVGKRGGEYVKVKGEYMSLAKFNKKINK